VLCDSSSTPIRTSDAYRTIEILQWWQGKVFLCWEKQFKGVRGAARVVWVIATIEAQHAKELSVLTKKTLSNNHM